MMKKILVVIGCAMTSISQFTSAADRLVPAQYATIQAAIDAAANGDVVQISPGTYAGPIDLKGKAITVRGTNADDPSATTVSGGESVVRCISGELATTVVENLTVTGGTAAPEYSAGPFGAVVATCRGAGVRIVGSSPTIRNCRIVGNTISVSAVQGQIDYTFGYGAGVYVINGSPTITRCLVAANLITTSTSYFRCESFGAGVYLSNSNSQIVDCSVTGNVARANNPPGPGLASGGGIYATSGGRPRLQRCTITSNMLTSTTNGCSGTGCGLALITAADVVDCAVSDNTINGCGGSVAGVYFEAIGSTLASTRICGNSGTQSSGAYVNLGGNTVAASCPSCPGDLTGDNRVDGIDLGILLSRWGTCTN